MGIEKFGTDAVELNTGTGGIVSADGLTLIDTGSTGETSLLFGPAAQRELTSLVANGTFTAFPPDPDADINANNPLPYFTYAANLSGLSAAMTTATTAAQQALTFTAAASGAVGSSITFTRYLPIAGNANRNEAYQAEVYVLTGTGTSGDRGRVRLTITATAVDANLTPLTATATQFNTAFNLSNKSLATDWFTPDATAAFILLTLTASIPTTAPAAAVTMPITELRLNAGQSTTAFPNAVDPTHGVWVVNSTDVSGVDTFTITQAASTDTTPGLWLEYNEATLEPTASLYADGGLVNIDAGVGGTIEINADTIAATSATTGTSGSGTILAAGLSAQSTTTSDLVLSATGSDVVVQDTNVANGTNPRIFMRDKSGTTYAGIKSGAAGIVQILSGSSATTYGQLWAARIYPMNGSTASRYIFDDGTNTAFSGSVLTGTLTSTGVVTGNNFTADTITGTTATTNAAIWVLTSGTTYNLRRNTSSARYKTDITDADAAVLEAAKRVKARHYTSTIADEAGATRLGFIAEEVYDAGLTHAVGLDAEGRPETLDSTALIAALFVRIEDLENRLAKLER